VKSGDCHISQLSTERVFLVREIDCPGVYLQECVTKQLIDTYSS